MEVLSEDDAMKFESSGFEFVGKPVTIKVGDEDSVRLNNPVHWCVWPV